MLSNKTLLALVLLTVFVIGSFFYVRIAFMLRDSKISDRWVERMVIIQIVLLVGGLIAVQVTHY